jgi:dihydroorotase
MKRGETVMAQILDVLLKRGTVATADAIGEADVGIVGGKIAAIGDLSRADAAEVIDCKGLHLLPGVIDSQVHFREPGLEHKEDLESGSRAAVMGGVTAVFEMPNTKPLTITPELLDDKLARASGRMHCDFAFWFGGTAGNASELRRWENLEGTPGVKVFMGSSTGDLLVADDASLLLVLKNTRRRVAVHSEDEFMLEERKGLRVAGDASSHPVWRSPEVALSSTKRLIKAARATGAQVHVLHISTAEEMDFLAQNRDVASIEVLPHHLTLHAPDCYERLGSLAQMNPPVRDKRHQDRLWQAVREGLVDVLGSDHAPHTLEEKAKPYPDSPSGMAGVQTLVCTMLNHVNEGRLTLQRFIELTSRNQAKLFHIVGKGELAVGYDGDLTIVDLKRRETISNRWIASKCGWTPYDGMSVQGWAMGTLIRGQRVMWEGELVMPSQGAAVRFARP